MALEIIIHILLLAASFCVLICVCISLYVAQSSALELLDRSSLTDSKHTHSDADLQVSLYSLPLVSHGPMLRCVNRQESRLCMRLPSYNVKLQCMLTNGPRSKLIPACIDTCSLL